MLVDDAGKTVEVVFLADRPSAVPDLAAWLFHEWGHRYPGSSVERSARNLGLRRNVDRLPLALVAVAGDEPVGTASILETEDPGDQPGPWVSGVCVLPHRRGQGIATSLMQRLEVEAVRLGARRLLLAAGAPGL